MTTSIRLRKVWQPSAAFAERIRNLRCSSRDLRDRCSILVRRARIRSLRYSFAGFGLVLHSPSVFATCVAHRGLRLSATFAVRVFATCVAHSRASPYSDKLTEYCLHASMTQYPVSLSLHGSLPTRTLYHILGELQGEVVG